MPRLIYTVPKYRRHKASGQAIVTIHGKDHYLGPWKSRASQLEYDRLIAEWQAAGRPVASTSSPGDLTIAEVADRYFEFAKQHYRKNGESTREVDNVRHALRPLLKLYESTLVGQFGPKALKAIQHHMIQTGLSRRVINSRIGRIKRLFRWAVSEELAPASLSHSLDTVAGLQRGRTEAREIEPVSPVADEVVEATLPHLPRIVADMVRFHRLTGCRPSEVCMVRPCDLDRSDIVWLYRPESHKSEHHGRERTIAIGPQAQQVLAPYLLRDSTTYCFSPSESNRERMAKLRANRKTKVQPSQTSRAVRNPRKKPGDRYTRLSYLSAIHRACAKAFPPPDNLTAEEKRQWVKSHHWHPNQLRHAVATKINSRFGLEAAQVVLGHSKADVTQVYAKRDRQRAIDVMREVG